MKKKIIAAILFVLMGTTGLIQNRLFAIDIVLTPPTYEGEHSDILNSEMAKLFDDFKSEIGDALGGISDIQSSLIKGFANTTVFSSAGATQRTFYGYKTFGATIGAMGSLQFPRNPITLIKDITSALGSFGDDLSDFDDFFDKLGVTGNNNFGVDIQPLNAQFGLNTSKFLLDGLYLGLKLGYMKLDFSPYVTYGNFSAGLMGNYQIFKHRSLGKNLFVWRGLNAGTGIIYQNTNLDFKYSLNSEIVNIPINGENVSPILEMNLLLDWKSSSFTIPIEAMTSVRLLGFLNIPLGLGVDIGFGKSNMLISGSIDNISFASSELPFDLREKTPGYIEVSLQGNESSSIFHPKLMSGIGFSLGPVVIDFPITYYFTENGFNAGLTIGVIR